MPTVRAPAHLLSREIGTPAEEHAARRQARSSIPPGITSMIASMAEAAKERPWIVAYWAATDLEGMAQRLSDGSLVGDADYPCNAVSGEMVTMLLEGMSPLPNGCDDAFQAAVYKRASRAGLAKLGLQFIDEIGGQEIFSAHMTEWAEENEGLIKTLPRTLPVLRTARPGDGPPGSLDGLLDRWTHIARTEFEARGESEPLAVGVLPDGHEMLFTMRLFESDVEELQFWDMAAERFRAAGVVQTVEIAEAWWVPSGLGSHPGRSQSRGEAVVVIVSDGQIESLGTASTIERDWGSGVPSLKAPERGETMRACRRTGPTAEPPRHG